MMIVDIRILRSIRYPNLSIFAQKFIPIVLYPFPWKYKIYIIHVENKTTYIGLYWVEYLLRRLAINLSFVNQENSKTCKTIDLLFESFF